MPNESYTFPDLNQASVTPPFVISLVTLTSAGFTGRRLDTDSGLMYYGARFYDPVVGYFASADTMGVEKGHPRVVIAMPSSPPL